MRWKTTRIGLEFFGLFSAFWIIFMMLGVISFWTPKEAFLHAESVLKHRGILFVTEFRSDYESIGADKAAQSWQYGSMGEAIVQGRKIESVLLLSSDPEMLGEALLLYGEKDQTATGNQKAFKTVGYNILDHGYDLVGSSTPLPFWEFKNRGRLELMYLWNEYPWRIMVMGFMLVIAAGLAALLYDSFLLVQERRYAVLEMQERERRMRIHEKNRMARKPALVPISLTAEVEDLKITEERERVMQEVDIEKLQGDIKDLFGRLSLTDAVKKQNEAFEAFMKEPKGSLHHRLKKLQHIKGELVKAQEEARELSRRLRRF